MGPLDRGPPRAVSPPPPAGSRISSPISRPPRVNSRSGAFVTNVRPALRPAMKLERSSAGPLRTNTRTNPGGPRSDAKFGKARSEEHTSELQSLAYLVCRLLLEKKKKKSKCKTDI